MKIKNLFLVFMCLVTLCSSIPCFASDNLTTHYVFVEPYHMSEIEQQIKEYYGLNNVQNFKCTFKSSHFVYVKNLKQGELNKYYKDQTGKTLDGTCTAVAITGVVSYYKGSINTNVAFKNLVSQAINKGYASDKGVIKGSKEKTCITLCASQNGVSKAGYEYILNKRARVRNALNDGTPAVLSFEQFEHSVLAKGTEIYTISYKNPSTGKTVTKDVEFFYVNEGWGYTQGSLILSDFFSDSTGDAYILK